MNAPGHPIPATCDRALGALYGLALGDALGMPSQTLSPEDIRAHYGTIEDFVAPFPDHPVSHGLQAGQVTDDTEQALLLARRLIRDPGRFDAAGWAEDLLGWEADVRRRGLRDLLGPSSRAALEAIAQGVPPDQAGRAGTTNGAAMRIAPVGIACPADDLGALVDTVEATCRATHNTGEAIAAAAAVAAAVSARIAGAGAAATMALALEAARMGQTRGHPVGVPDMADRIARAVRLAAEGPSLAGFARRTGTSVASHEAVPAAFGLIRLAGWDLWRAALLAANIGDDTDTIGAMAGAICGAGIGLAGFPPDRLRTLRQANRLDIDAIAPALVALRQQAESARAGAGR
jgi:ADP-ribosylglycohydrolase